MEENAVVLDAYSVIDQHIGELTEQWDLAMPGSKEAEAIHKQLVETLRLKKEYSELDCETQHKAEVLIQEAKFKEKELEAKSKTSKTEKIRFLIQTVVQLIGIGVPAALAVAMLRFSNSGDYQTGDEAKVFNWLFGLSKDRRI